MKCIPVVILAVVALVAGVTGCDSMRRYDARLAAADSLMRSAPDSALAIVQALTADSLASEGDRAYRDLLLTQARYRCYVTATSDSDINRALAWYRAHSGEREKLTRALIYKGAVMEELGHPDSAMLYYKQAEATADPDDYFNLGYSKMRIITLYQNQLSVDSSLIPLIKEAIYCFEQIGDTNYLISCYGQLGAIYGINKPDSTENCLTHAIELAQAFKPEKQYTYKSKLASIYYYYHHDYNRAKDLAMDVFCNGRAYSHEYQFYYYAVLSYLRLGLTDSAKMVLEAIPAPICAVDSMNWFEMVAKIAKAENNFEDYDKYIKMSNDIQVRIISGSKGGELKQSESEYHRTQAEYQVEKVNQGNQLLSFILSIIFTISVLLVLLTVRLKRDIRNSNTERAAIEHELNTIITELQEKQFEQEIKKQTVSQLVGYRIDALNELFSSIKFKSSKHTQENVRSIVTLSGVIKGLSEVYHIMNIKLSDDFWEKMKVSVDGEYNGIVSYVEKEYPILTLKELRLFTLLCAGMSPQIIKICLNYSHVNSVTNNRTIIIKQKMGLDLSFEEFVDRYMKKQL